MQLGSGTGTSFPTAVDTATTEINAPAAGKTKARAEVINDILSALIAIETSIKDGTALPKYPSVQQVVTGSRTVGTVYQNTTGRPMFVAIAAYGTVINGAFTLASDSSNPPTTGVAVAGTPVNGCIVNLCSWVLPGNWYKVSLDSGTPTLNRWTEWY